jgi:hypothetical protein
LRLPGVSFARDVCHGESLLRAAGAASLELPGVPGAPIVVMPRPRIVRVLSLSSPNDAFPWPLVGDDGDVEGSDLSLSSVYGETGSCTDDDLWVVEVRDECIGECAVTVDAGVRTGVPHMSHPSSMSFGFWGVKVVAVEERPRVCD